MPVPGAGDRIRAAVSRWPEVTTAPHRFGGLEFRVGRREIGHIHGDRLVDIPFPKRVRDEVLARGDAVAHHVLPDSGWVSVWVDRPEDVERALALLGAATPSLASRSARTPAPAHGAIPGTPPLTDSARA